MAVSKTTRLGLTRWTEDTDPWNRDDFDDDNAALEASVAMYAQGTAAARPAAGKAGRHYYATDTDELSYDTGAGWQLIRTPEAQADLTLGAGLAVAAGTPTPRVYRRARMATLHFRLSNAAGLASPGHIITVPAGFRPPTDWPIALALAGGLNYNSSLKAADGRIELGGSTGANINPVCTVTYPVA